MDFLLGVLDLDPQTRWTPRQALQHPFITGGIFQVPAPPRSVAPSLTWSLPVVQAFEVALHTLDTG